MKEIDLKTVRQFYMDNVVLSDTGISSHQEERVHDYLTEKVIFENEIV